MTILARIVRFLLWLLVLSLSVRALRRLFGLLLENRGSSPQHAAKGSASPPPTKTGRHLVRDPVCGMYVDETLSRSEERRVGKECRCGGRRDARQNTQET